MKMKSYIDRRDLNISFIKDEIKQFDSKHVKKREMLNNVKRE